MANLTKQELEKSLKRLLLRKPLDKITIQDLTSDCKISRMTFYYHFKDIYDLVEWSCMEDASRALEGKKTYATWQEGLLQIFEAVLENKPFILNVYRSVSREQIETYLFRLTYSLIRGVVDEQADLLETEQKIQPEAQQKILYGTERSCRSVQEADRKFIADFYKYSFVGIMLDWIKQGMKTDYHVIAEKMGTTLRGNIRNSLCNFLKE